MKFFGGRHSYLDYLYPLPPALLCPALLCSARASPSSCTPYPASKQLRRSRLESRRRRPAADESDVIPVPVLRPLALTTYPPLAPSRPSVRGSYIQRASITPLQFSLYQSSRAQPRSFNKEIRPFDQLVGLALSASAGFARIGQRRVVIESTPHSDDDDDDDDDDTAYHRHSHTPAHETPHSMMHTQTTPPDALDVRSNDLSRILSLQKYLVLNSEQESLLRRLSVSSSTSSSPAAETPASTHSRSPSDASCAIAAEDDEHLLAINQEMKTTLTELLNCELVRRDASFRTWAQTRLLEVERGLKMRRRRRSSAGWEERAVVEGIREGLEDA